MQQLLSALADPERLRLYAKVVLAGDGGSPLDAGDAPRVHKQLGRLVAAGLVARQPDGGFTARADVFQDALRGDEPVETDESLPPRLTGFFRHGRLVSIPVRPAVRRELLEHLTGTRFEPDRDYSEAEVNEAFRTVHEDCSALRRYCVIDGLLTRTRDGSVYRRAVLRSDE